MEKTKPAFKSSTSSGIKVPAPYSKEPLCTQTAPATEAMLSSDDGIKGSHPAFDDSRIKATVVPTDSPYDERSGFSEKVTRTACKGLSEDKKAPFGK
jgi:hypothetical protein